MDPSLKDYSGDVLIELSWALERKECGFFGPTPEFSNHKLFRGFELLSEALCFVNRKPFDPSAFLPQAILCLKLLLAGGAGVCSCLGGALEFTKTMLFAVSPIASVNATVCPIVSTVAVLLVLLVLAFVTLAIWPGVPSIAVHDASFPLAYVYTTILPLVAAMPADLVVRPLAEIAGSVRPKVCALTLFDSLLIVSEEGCSSRPCFLTPTMHPSL